MKNFRDLSEQEMRTINGGGLVSSISGIVQGAIGKDWVGMTKSIVQTAINGVKAVGALFAGLFGRA